MKHLAIHGIIRGNVKKTTVPGKGQPRPKDKGKQKVRAPAPNMPWVSDFTYVSTWQKVVYVAFIIDTFADKIVGWRVSSLPKTDFVLDALGKALHDRRPIHKVASFTTLTAAGSICPFAIPNDWRMLRSISQLAALAISMTPPCPRPSTVCTKQKSFTG
jgi:transposase InsO family protein